MKKILLFSFAFLAALCSFAQGAHDFRITEVYIAQEGEKVGYQDEFGDVHSWIEIENTSYTTHDIRNCFLTINKGVLVDTLSAPAREAMMSIIPSGDERTNLKGKQIITFFADSCTNRGTLHTNFKLRKTGEPIFIALYDGNAVDLLDSVTIPADLKPGFTYVKIDDEWKTMPKEKATPDSPNIHKGNSDKVKEWKEKDPHGLAMTVISMGIVFGCLLSLFVFFYIFGWIINKLNRMAKYKAIMKLREEANRVVVIAKEGLETKGIPTENYVAAISLALHEYLGNMHDIESGIITIQHHASEWENKDHNLRHEVSHFVPTN